MFEYLMGLLVRHNVCDVKVTEMRDIFRWMPLRFHVRVTFGKLPLAKGMTL